jgi:hypothetical protein
MKSRSASKKAERSGRSAFQNQNGTDTDPALGDNQAAAINGTGSTAWLRLSSW